MPLSFVKSYLANPAHIGAVAPSSRHLANAMCRHVGAPSQVLEIGAGTGPITRELLAQGHSVIAIERDPRLAQKLKMTCPHAQVIEANLEDCRALMRRLPADTCAVSSLPFRSVPDHIGEEWARQLLDFVSEGNGRALVQFTYAFIQPFPAPAYLEWRRVALVLKNLPPAFVWRLQHKGAL